MGYRFFDLIHPTYSQWTRPLKDLFVYSAKPWDYLIPSFWHPVWGPFVAPWIQAHLFGSNITEQTLFLGWTALGCAGWMIGQAFKSKSPLPEDWRWTIFGIFAAMGLCLIWSGPPFVPLGGWIVEGNRIQADWKWPLPSWWMHAWLPMFRVYSRFAVGVQMGCSVLFGLGLAWIRRKVAWKGRLGLVLLLGMALAWEYQTRFVLFDTKTVPAVYRWLAEEPGEFAVLEYPWRESGHAQTYRYLFYQRIHGKHLINGGNPNGTMETIRQEFRDLAHPHLGKVLNELGVRYVLVHPYAYDWSDEQLPRHFSVFGRTIPIEARRWADQLPPPAREGNRSLRLIRTFPDTWVYEPVP
jgi:hypothetical protein